MKISGNMKFLVKIQEMTSNFGFDDSLPELSVDLNHMKRVKKGRISKRVSDNMVTSYFKIFKNFG